MNMFNYEHLIGQKVGCKRFGKGFIKNISKLEAVCATHVWVEFESGRLISFTECGREKPSDIMPTLTFGHEICCSYDYEQEEMLAFKERLHGTEITASELWNYFLINTKDKEISKMIINGTIKALFLKSGVDKVLSVINIENKKLEAREAGEIIKYIYEIVN